MSKQNYTIFINQNSISLVAAPENIKPVISLSLFNNYVRQCLTKSGKSEEHFTVKTSSPKELLELLKKELKHIQAAGGIVEENNQYLYIKRYNLWDLPKGKIEKNEEIREAAMREVEEECGVTDLEIVKELPTSYHIYMHKDKPALKETFWFLMRSKKKIESLTPQTEEGITELKFADKDFLLHPDTPTYNSLVYLMMGDK